MRGLLRLVALLIYVGAGYLIGSLVGRLVLIPVAAVAHVSHGLQMGLSVSKPNSGVCTPMTTSPRSLYFAAQART